MESCTNSELCWAGLFRIVGKCQLMKMTVMDSQVTVIKTDMNRCSDTTAFLELLQHVSVVTVH